MALELNHLFPTRKGNGVESIYLINGGGDRCQFGRQWLRFYTGNNLPAHRFRKGHAIPKNISSNHAYIKYLDLTSPEWATPLFFQRDLISLQSVGEFTGWAEFSPDGNTLLGLSWTGVADLCRAPSWEEIEAKEKERKAP
jgi:hypothetical protein